MATNTVTTQADGLRLECLEALCSQLATGILTAKTVLRDNAEDANVAHVVADALDRLGWMADRAARVAMAERNVPIAGDIENWIFGDHVVGMLNQLDAT
jgi:hypothetical protein